MKIRQRKAQLKNRRVRGFVPLCAFTVRMSEAQYRYIEEHLNALLAKLPGSKVELSETPKHDNTRIEYITPSTVTQEQIDRKWLDLLKPGNPEYTLADIYEKADAVFKELALKAPESTIEVGQLDPVDRAKGFSQTLIMKFDKGAFVEAINLPDRTIVIDSLTELNSSGDTE